MIHGVALGIAACDADHRVGEVGGNNRGPRVRSYLASVGLREGDPWCAALVFYAWSYAARLLNAPNPLERVPLKGLVQSYYDVLADRAVDPRFAPPGSLVLMKFGRHNDRLYDHIGLLLRPIEPGAPGCATVEGNTSPEAGGDQREGDGVYLRVRELDEGLRPLLFIDPTDPGD